MENNHRKVLDVARYLQRIGVNGPVQRDAGTLDRLQELHLRHVPYENLDILRGVSISLDIPALFHKIVIENRGGYCFELNALFGWLLQELGYPVTHWFARFWRDEPNPPPKRRHHVLCVEVKGERYLCDVGVGGIIPRRPIRLVEGLEQQQGQERYQVMRDSEYGWMLREWKHGEWHRLYSFTEEPQLSKDFIMASYWCEHAPDSIFTKAPMVSIHTESGRNSVSGQEFRIFSDKGVQIFTPETPEAFRDALRAHFGIVIEWT